MKNQPENKTSASQFSKTDGGKTKSNAIEVPSISLPKGGGAIKGIDEKFSVNAVNGTSSFSIPLPFSPGRGASPSLSLSYNSGGGNSIFGLGWSLGLSSIKRKTDKGLPLYFDGSDSDTFLFSEAEDLVPEFKKDADGSFSTDDKGDYIINDKNSSDNLYTIRFYKPRIEGLFARIERWIRKSTGEIRWKVTTKENVSTLFGWSTASRLADPNDNNRIYEWLPEFSFDDKGNCSRYIYKQEDEKGFNHSLLHNRNRLVNGKITYTNTYLEKVLYGNKTPYRNAFDDFPTENDYLFSTVFDYGEYEWTAPYRKLNDWDFRDDAFSEYKAGFEIRTTRLCQRVLLFHHFNEYNGLVQSLNLRYDTSSERDFTFLESITSYGYVKKSDGNYSSKSLPPIMFEYQKHSWSKEVKSIAVDDLVHAPEGLDEQNYQFTDLYGEGLSGILTEQANGWYYKHNRGGGKFEQARLVSPKPSFIGLGKQMQLADLDADGGKQLVSFGTEPKGYFELNDDNEWESFRNFQNLPNINFGDPNTRMLDLDGDGKPEILISEENVFTWYTSEGRSGFSQAHKTHKPFDEEAGPHIVFADQKQTIFLADMSGSGMTDIVRIRNGEVCYWPNLGYGKFGTKVAMDNAPLFDHPDSFNPSCLRLADIDGSGTTDIIYLGKNKFSCWMNLSGNSFHTIPFQIEAFPEKHNFAKITVVDLLGNGVACIVWSSKLTKDSHASIKYIDLMNSRKPHLMVSYKNNLGKEVSLEYAPSTKFYLEDKLAGKPWVTKLHFPVHCVVKTETRDKVSGVRFASSYQYHHGYYDHAEREFRGFGRIEQLDVENFGVFALGNTSSPFVTQDQTLYQPPIKTITWIHTGAFVSREKILNQFQQEYFSPEVIGFEEKILHEPDLDNQNLSTEEWAEALRACKGMTLRQEVYELEVEAFHELGQHVPVKLYHTAFHNCHIKMLQPKQRNRNAIFLVTESEKLSYQYELSLVDTSLNPDPRVAHTLNLETDEFGNILETISIVYPRINAYADESLPTSAVQLINEVQQEIHLSYKHNRFTNDVIDLNHHRLRMACEVATYELKGMTPEDGFYFTLDQFREARIRTNASTIHYHQLFTNGLQKRLVEQVRILYFNENIREPLPLGELSHLGLPYETYNLALTEELLIAIFRDKLSADIRVNLDNSRVSGYLSGVNLTNRFPGEDPNQYWIRSGIAGFAEDAASHFYLPEKYIDAFGNETTLEFDPLDLFIQRTLDPVGNVNQVIRFDYRVMAPLEMMDLNANLTEVKYDALGLPAAVAVKGKGSQGDNLEDVEIDIDNETIIRFFTSTYNESEAVRLLGNATARHIYYMGETIASDGTLLYGLHPPCAAGIVREKHVANLAEGESSPLQVGFEYSDGSGQVLVKKIQAEPSRRDTPMRWIANGKTVLNNKGKPVKQYEPYFSENVFGEPDHRFEEPREMGVTPIMYYDAAGRPVRTELPDGTFTKVEFSPWHQAAYDANDTISESGNVWYERNSALSAPIQNQRAARLARIHANTPSLSFLDSLGREVITIAHNKYENRDGVPIEEKFLTYVKMDAEGKPLWIKDARGNRVMQYIFPFKPDGMQEDDWTGNYTPCYDISGNLLFQHSMDGGDKWTLMDAVGQPLYTWDSRGNLQQLEYDALRRPVTVSLFNEIHASSIIVSLIQYGDNAGLMSYEESQRLNLRGSPYRTYDQSGMVVNKEMDFKGNILEVQKRMAEEYEEDIDWTSALNLPSTLEVNILLMPEAFSQLTEYDALNRMVRLFNWHRGNSSRVAVYLPRYNARGLLAGEDLIMNALKTDEGEKYLGGERIYAIKNIEYNAKAQKKSLQYGNRELDTVLTTSSYTYDSATFRITRQETRRHRDSAILQDLNYHYDPSGNITAIENHAEDDIFFQNQRIEPDNYYEYDALYRLIYAEGREHLGQNDSITPPDAYNNHYTNHSHPGDGNAMSTYRERYTYDSVGNILHVSHYNSVTTTLAWNRYYQYATSSNRLMATEVRSTAPDTFYTDLPTLRETLQYNIHGSIERMTHLPRMEWDFTEHLKHISIAGHPASPPSLQAWYCYDGQKQRSRKVINKQGDIREERIYLGGLEWYRRWERDELAEEIETIHLFEGEQRLLIIDHVIQTNDDLGSGLLYRYQYSNHIGSVAIEMNENAVVFSYEEYHPYGTAAYHATNADVRSIAKRYCYTGMERDEESGLNYHTARYYLPWLGRWGSADPIGIGDGYNLYVYSRSNPIMRVDINGKQSSSILNTARRAGFSQRDQYLSMVSIVSGEVNYPRLSQTRVTEGTDVGTVTAGPIEDWARIRMIPNFRHFDYELLESQLDILQSQEGGSRVDESLALVIGFRESSAALYTRTPRSPGRTVDTFGGGGIDDLYSRQRELRDSGLIPADMSWERGLLNGAIVPRDELLVAYGARVALAAQDFEGAAIGAGFTEEQIAGLSSLQRRIWTALFFAADGGLNWTEYQTAREEREAGTRRSSNFGGRTLLSFLHDAGLGLDAITDLSGAIESLPEELQRTLGRTGLITNNVRIDRAMRGAISAEALERLMPISDDPCISVGLDCR